MPIDTPTKTDGDTPGEIGRAVEDRPVPFRVDRRYDVPADVYERLKDVVINNAGRLTIIEATGGGYLGSVYSWNRTDLTEFDTDNPISFADDIANGPSGTVVASVETDEHDQAVIRLTATSLSGAWLLPLLEASAVAAAFPRGVVIEVVFGTASSTSVVPVFGVISDDEGGDAEGVLMELSLGTSTARLRTVHGDAIQDADTLGLDNPGTMDLNATVAGIRVRFELWMSDAMQDPDGAPGETILGYRAHVDVDSQDGHKHGAGATGLTGYATLSAATGEPMDKIAIGLWAGSPGLTATLDVLDLKVYPHPMDL